jgi:hypothetical protein
MPCDAVPQAQAWMGKPWKQAVAGMATFAQDGQAAPSKGSAQAHHFKFNDNSRIRVDVQVAATADKPRLFGDGDLPHMAIYPPNDASVHLSVDGVVVPMDSATAHIPLGLK